MPLRNFTEDLEYQANHGCDTTSPLPMVPEGFVVSALNCNVEKNGGYSKRSGYLHQLDTPWAGQAIRDAIEFKITGVASVITLVSDTKVGQVSGGAVVDVPGLVFTNGHQIETLQFDNRLFFYNGHDNPMLWDGGISINPASVRQVGISAPIAGSLTAVGAGAGSLVANQNYIWAYTYANYDGTTGQLLAESSPVLSGVVNIGANTAATLAYTAGDPTTATNINIYRTVANGTILLFEKSLAVGSVTTSSTAADAALTYQMELDNSRIEDLAAPKSPGYPTVVRNRVFVKTNDNEVRFSKMGQFGPLPESFEVKSISTTMGRFGNEDFIVGLNSINGIPLVLKRKSIGRLEEQGLPDNTQSVDLVGYTYREIAESYGAISHFSAIQVYNELIYLSYNNIYATNGMNVRAVANSIEDTIRSLDFEVAGIEKLSAVNDEQFKRVYFSAYQDVTSTEPDFIIVGDYDDYPEFKWTFYEKGSNKVTHPAFRVGCFFKVYNINTGAPEVYFGSADAVTTGSDGHLIPGQYYKMNTGDSDDFDGATGLIPLGIWFEIVTRPYFMKEPMVVKLFERARIFLEAGANSYNLTVAAQYDLGIDMENAQVLPLVGVHSYWGPPTPPHVMSYWGPLPVGSPHLLGIWSGRGLDELTYYGHRRAKFQQLIIQQLDANCPINILGWGTSGGIQAPR